MTQASSRSAPTTIPGNRPARKTPGGKEFLPLSCDFVESIPVDRLVVAAAAAVAEEVDFEVELAEVEDEDEEDADLGTEPRNELSAIVILQNGSPFAGVMQSYPNGQHFCPHVEGFLSRAVVKMAELGNRVMFWLWMLQSIG
jgi:hypothetical protein